MTDSPLSPPPSPATGAGPAQDAASGARGAHSSAPSRQDAPLLDGPTLTSPALKDGVGAPGAMITAGSGETILDNDHLGGSEDVDIWLLIVAGTFPMFAALAVIAAYEVSNDGYRSLAIGAGSGALVLLVLAAIYRGGHFNTAQHASVATYNVLCERLQEALSVQAPADARVLQYQIEAASTVRRCGAAFRSARAKRGLHWMLGEGYLDLYAIVSRAEEALLRYAPLPAVIAAGLTDYGRLQGSRIPAADILLLRLRQALLVLSPTSLSYLPPSLPAGPGALNPIPAAGNAGTAEQGTMAPDLEARVILQDIRATIDSYRASRRAELVHARENLLATMFLTGLIICVLLILVIIARPARDVLLTGAVFYSLGVVVGLFNHLAALVGTDSLQEDYGLATIGLFQTAMLSGIAAVLGVYVGVALPIAVTDSVFIGKGVAQISGIPSPADVYNVARYPFDIVLALIFGLTPRLLITRLTASTQQSRTDLKTSGTGG